MSLGQTDQLGKYNVSILLNCHLVICSTPVAQKCIPASCAVLLAELLLFYLAALHQLTISTIIGLLAAPRLPDHLGPELGVGHTAQLCLGQHVEDGPGVDL